MNDEDNWTSRVIQRILNDLRMIEKENEYKRITTLNNWKWRDWFGSVEWNQELNLDIGVSSIIMNNGWLIRIYWVQANVILWLIRCVMNTWMDWMDILKWWRKDTRRIQWESKCLDWFSALETQWIILHSVCWEVLSPYMKNEIDSHFELLLFWLLTFNEE